MTLYRRVALSAVPGAKPRHLIVVCDHGASPPTVDLRPRWAPAPLEGVVAVTGAWVAVGCAVVAVLLGLVARLAVRRWAERVAGRPVPVEDRVHLLRRASLGLVLGALLVGGVLGGVAVGMTAGRHHHHGPDVRAVGIVALVVCYLAPLVLVSSAFRPVVARLRDTPVKPEGRVRTVAVGVLGGVVLAVALRAGFALSPRHGAGHLLGIVATYAVVLVVLQSLLAPVLLRLQGARPLPPELEQRLAALADRMGVTVRGRLLVPDRRRRIANAAQVGALPGLRYIVITEYLVANMSPEEVDAVVAHEYGHVRGQHLPVKAAAVIATWAALEAVITFGSGAHGLAAAAYLVAALGFPVAIVLVNGVVGIALERRADAVAAQEVGDEPLASALTELGRLNHTPARTGRFWNLLSQHPGLVDRIARLRVEGGSAAAYAPSGARS